MIDLHTHTKYSDGTWDVTKLLKEAQSAKIEVLSITDHDSVKAYKELEEINYKKIYEGKIISGCEFSTVYDGIFFHMLAYDFDINKVNKFIQNNYKPIDLQKEFDYMLNSCRTNKIIVGDISYNNIGWPIDTIYKEIRKYEENKEYFNNEEWNDIDIFYNSCITNKDFPVYVDFSIHYPNASIIKEAVKEAGGKLFVAHIFKYKLKDAEKFLEELKNHNIIDGIEVYHSSFNDKQINWLEKYCNRNDLLMSGGSDCHGNKKANRKIGIGFRNLNISREILAKWNI